MVTNLLTTLNWTDPKVIGIVVGIIIIVVAIVYLVWAYFSKHWPFKE